MKTTTIFHNHKSLSAALLIVVILANLCLSVSALQCHQCNSHLDEDCNSLLLSTPHAPRDDHYLRDCEVRTGELAFCRKTAITIEVTHEKRVIRSCGWIPERDNEYKDECFSADNDGYKQTLCTCATDGCNAATTQFGSAVSQVAIAIFTGLSVIMGSSIFRQSS